MLRHARLLLRKPSSSSSSPNFPKQNPFLLFENTFSISKNTQQQWLFRHVSGLASSPSLSIWRRKKEMGKEGLIVAKELKRLRSNSVRLDRFIRSHVSRLLKSDLFAVLAEFQRQDQVFLCMKVSLTMVLFGCQESLGIENVFAVSILLISDSYSIYCITGGCFYWVIFCLVIDKCEILEMGKWKV